MAGFHPLPVTSPHRSAKDLGERPASPQILLCPRSSFHSTRKGRLVGMRSTSGCCCCQGGMRLLRHGLRSAREDAFWVKPGRFGVPLLQTWIPPGLQERDQRWLTGLVWGEAARGIVWVANLAFQGAKLLSENNRR